MQPDLIATCWTTSGKSLPIPGLDLSNYSLAERMQTAAGLGWDGFGILNVDLQREIKKNGIQGVKKLVNDCGFKFIELELINDWYTDGTRRVDSDRSRKELLNAAAELGALHVKAGSEVSSHHWPWKPLLDDLYKLAEEARIAGTRIAIEPLPFAQINTIEKGVLLVDEVGHDSLGLLIDIWHVVHGHTKFEWISNLPNRYIFGIELNDAQLAIENDLFYDTIHNRQYCGEGEFQVVDFIQAVLMTGYRGPFGVEILSDKHRSFNLTTALTIARQTTLEQFVLASAQSTKM